VLTEKGEISQKDLAFIISKLIEAYSQLKYSPIHSLPLQIALVNIFERLGEKETASKKEPNKELEKKSEKPRSKEEKQKEPQKKETKNESNNSDINLTIDEIKSKWDQVLEKIRPFNHHLVAFLAKSKPVSMKNGKLELLVAYKFHKQRIEQKKSKDAVGEVFTEVYGSPLQFYCTIDDSMKAEVSDKDFKMDSNEDLVEEIFGDDEE
jgi:hypothetical protein